LAGIVSSVLTNGGYTLLYPWYDPRSTTVYTQAYSSGWDYLVNNDATHSDEWLKYVVANAVNKNNPFWYELFNPSDAKTYPGLTGSTVQGGHDRGFCLAVCHVREPYDNTMDYWWVPSKFAKYGFFAFGANNSYMPVEFINLNPCSFIAPGIGESIGFSYAAFGTNVLDITTYGLAYFTQITLAGVGIGVPAV
jgi:hypothetical protein